MPSTAPPDGQQNARSRLRNWRGRLHRDLDGNDRAECREVAADAQGSATFDSAGTCDDQFPGRDERPGSVGIAAAAQDQIRQRIIDGERIARARQCALIGTRRGASVNKAGGDRSAGTVGQQRTAVDADGARGKRGIVPISSMPLHCASATAPLSTTIRLVPPRSMWPELETDPAVMKNWSPTPCTRPVGPTARLLK